MFPVMGMDAWGSACAELGCVESSLFPGFCADCQGPVVDGVGVVPKQKKDKKANITNGTSKPYVPKPPDPPREYRPLAEFAEFLPGGPPGEILPPI